MFFFCYLYFFLSRRILRKNNIQDEELCKYSFPHVARLFLKFIFKLKNKILFKGNNKRRRTKRQIIPVINNEQTNHLQTMLETLIYIVHEINLEQVKLTTTINQLIKRINQNELYLNQLNINIETLYEQYHVRN
jgi:hypothetical protein